MSSTLSHARWVVALVCGCFAMGGAAWAQPAQEADRRTGATEASGTLQLAGDAPLAEGIILPPSEQYNVEPGRIDEAPQLDGILNEEAWLSAAVIDDFIQQEPSEGAPATERTVVRLVYDARAVYRGRSVRLRAG